MNILVIVFDRRPSLWSICRIMFKFLSTNNIPESKEMIGIFSFESFDCLETL